MASDFKDLFENWRPEDESKPTSSSDLPEPENRVRRALNEKEVKVVNVYEGIIEAPGAGTPQTTTFVLLRDNRGREFKIFVLRDVAWAISVALEQETPDSRPGTHDLMKTMIERLNATVERVTIDDLWQETFYAKITLAVKKGEAFDVDARPSDAIAVALRFRAPIYVAEYVLEAAQHE